MTDSFHFPGASGSNAGHIVNFPQTGSWSMVDLLAKPMNVTVGVLQRYSAGRVDPYTAVVGQALCSWFRLGTLGRRRIDNALSSLPAMSSLGNVLYFGFGAENLLSSLARTEEGALCVALCAALRDCYHEDVAVEVLLELARLTSVPKQYMPSSFEWKALLNACCGALATTTFSLQAEQLMSLSQESQRLGAFAVVEVQPSSMRTSSSPKSLAAALLGIGRITREELKAITIVGGADAGWLAAIADWLFNCSVKVTSSDGSTLYQNVQDGEEVQLHFIYSPRGGESLNPQELELHGKTYILENASQLFVDDGKAVGTHLVSGRVKWKHALSTTFTADFKRLMGMRQTLGKVIGSAARIFKAIAVSDAQIPLRYRAACASYCTDSYGTGFVQNTLALFPELADLKSFAGNACATKLEAAKSAYETGIQNLRTTCQCATCESSSTGFGYSSSRKGTKRDLDGAASGSEELDEGEDSDSGRNSDAEVEMDWDPDVFCMVVLAETIICLSRCLAHLNVTKDLYPMRSGLEAAYGRQLNLRRYSNSERRALEEMGPIVFCLDFDDSYCWKEDENVAEIRLYQALEIFAGRSPPESTWGVGGQCLNGICAFLAILEDVSDQNGAVGRINVLPGRIDLDGKSYSLLEDETLSHPRYDEFSTVLTKMQDTHDDQVWLRVKEGPKSLQCLLEIRQIQDKKGLSPILVGPAKLASMLASTRGWVSCKQPAKCPRVIGDQLDNQDGEISHGEIHLSCINATSTIQTVAALALASSLEVNCSVYLVYKQCLDCCARAALSIDRPQDRDRFCFLKSKS